MWSVLYAVDDVIFQIGPHASDEANDAAAMNAQRDREFDIRDQHVYYMSPDGKMKEYTMADLGVED